MTEYTQEPPVTKTSEYHDRKSRSYLSLFLILALILMPILFVAGWVSNDQVEKSNLLKAKAASGVGGGPSTDDEVLPTDVPVTTHPTESVQHPIVTVTPEPTNHATPTSVPTRIPTPESGIEEVSPPVVQQ